MTAAAAEDMAALRERVVLAERDDVVVLRISGEGAFALLDRVSTAPLFLREGEMRSALFLTEEARPFADVFIVSDSGEEQGFFVLAEGPDASALQAYLERHRPADAAAVVTPLGATHELLELDGPYAWELCSALFGPSVLGMTYLTLLRPPGEEAICFRAGKTGEYGYMLLVPRTHSAALRERLHTRGEPLGLRRVDRPVLDLAALENWHFSIRTLPPAGENASLTALELQLQWRVRPEREFVGAQAYRARRAAGPTVRATAFTAAGVVAKGERVRRGGEVVGEVLEAAWSHTRGQHVGIALLQTRLAHPWIDAFAVETASGTVPIQTVTPPLLDNRSLYVDPHRHRYATREADTFPPLVAV